MTPQEMMSADTRTLCNRAIELRGIIRTDLGKDSGTLSDAAILSHPASIELAHIFQCLGELVVRQYGLMNGILKARADYAPSTEVPQ